MIADKVNDLIKLAKFAGGRFDLVQAGGGNVSWKSTSGDMLIKTSGISLSEMASEDQCAKLSTNDVRNILDDASLLQTTSKSMRESQAQSLLNQANKTPNKRPSIETFLHAMLQAYTLHTHPIAVNHLVIRKDAEEKVKALFPKSIFVSYATPGIDLAIQLKNEIDGFIKQHQDMPKIVFLKNHGLLISADHAAEVQALTHEIVTTIEKSLQIDYQRYHTCTDIAHLVNTLTHTHSIAYLSEDRMIRSIWHENPDLLMTHPTSPDVFVFNGILPCVLTHLEEAELKQFYEKHGFYPKVILYQNHIYFINKTVRQAKEMEDVFKFHLMALNHAGKNLDVLPQDELLYLAGWEAEKFRQKQ